MEANNITKTDKVFVHANAPGTTILSEADLKSADSNGFTLTWTTNNNVGIEMLYVAFGHTGGVTAVDLTSFTAKTDGENVALEWKTGYEVDNLGFHVYREENGELFRVTPELVAGSAFLTGAGTPLTAGRSYTWIDASNVGGPSRTAGLEDHPARRARTGPATLGPLRHSPPPTPSHLRGAPGRAEPQHSASHH